MDKPIVVYLYVDGSQESTEAKRLLESEREINLEPIITYDPVELPRRAPLVLYNSALYQGIKEIGDLLAYMRWYRQKQNDKRRKKN